MVEVNPDPTAGGNRIQPDDGRDAEGRLPEPLDAAHWQSGNPDSPQLEARPGMPASQPAGTGPVVSATAPDDEQPVDGGPVASPDDDPTTPPPRKSTGTAKSTTTKS